ncbi:DUF4190 domain-containing protein [Micromonospora sp. WMMD1102]|uniref:DUF4190 domain-containing protein n=1 Tax=Micromonospora sp. WMMD1102 TaxID=3016105 RepID=UPI002414EDDE|nr:DUF4190 domain-containing protein [Micromonospora sp. WMMD1102]MDG4791691.1 DUF4190 domain-containing protein [Micromonospora sp. WMMD1102]
MTSGSTGNPSEHTAAPVEQAGEPAALTGDPTVHTPTPGAAGQPGWAPGHAGWAPGHPGYPYVVRRPTNGMAIAALVTGIVALFSCQLVGGVAIYLAKKARTEIQATGEEGSGFATAGLVLGWVSLGLVALGLLFFLAYLGFMGVLFATTASTSG